MPTIVGMTGNDGRYVIHFAGWYNAKGLRCCFVINCPFIGHSSVLGSLLTATSPPFESMLEVLIIENEFFCVELPNND